MQLMPLSITEYYVRNEYFLSRKITFKNCKKLPHLTVTHTDLFTSRNKIPLYFLILELFLACFPIKKKGKLHLFLKLREIIFMSELNSPHSKGQKISLPDAFARAAQLAAQGKLRQAEKICNDIIVANENFHQAAHLLGQIAFRDQKGKVAAQMTHKAILIDGSIAEYHRDLAEILSVAGKPKDAMIVIERALKINVNDPKSHYIAGIALSALGERPKSIEAYKKAVELNPKFGLAYNNLGSALESSGDVASAKEAYAEAVEINQTHAEAQNNLAAILISEGDVEGATKHLEAAIVARPKSLTHIITYLPSRNIRMMMFTLCRWK